LLAALTQIEAQLAAWQLCLERWDTVTAYCQSVAQNLETFDHHEKRRTLEVLAITVVANGRDWRIRGSIPGDKAGVLCHKPRGAGAARPEIPVRLQSLRLRVWSRRGSIPCATGPVSHSDGVRSLNRSGCHDKNGAPHATTSSSQLSRAISASQWALSPRCSVDKAHTPESLSVQDESVQWSARPQRPGPLDEFTGSRVSVPVSIVTLMYNPYNLLSVRSVMSHC
jgi:hypothetical protein